ncbi:MAG TPA: flagellar hook capping FlgD N-terminal domain-containing protein [Terriglobales bacterium]|nr:flagellar hook capping FlgD N-terminal domain-containing protein [Terriglobales bacterium]
MTVAAPHTAAPTPTPAPSVSTSNSNNMLNPNDFMTLLVAQLKNQDPTQPMDPTQFVSQLVQFNSLEQLININQDLTTPASTTPASTTPAASTPANS